MANIKNYLNNIKNAIFGQEVRGSIHDGIDAINKEVESTTNRQEHLETTFDQLTINAGNSNAEIVDARVGENGKSYAKLGDRLDSVDSQLEHIATLKTLEDIDGTEIKANTSVDVEYLRTKQITLLGKFYKDLREKQSVNICCQGDSITYGLDTTSEDKRPNDEGFWGTIASKTYPERLQEILNFVYPNLCTVQKRAYSGDGTKQGFSRWKTKSNANLTLVMYGINDAVNGDTGYVNNIDEFIKYYEQIIIRLLNQDSAIIILTPTKMRSCGDTRVDAYSNLLHDLGKKYCIPVIDTNEFTFNYGTDIYSDSVHFNGKGYSLLGAKIASLLIGDGVSNPKIVGNGSYLLPRLSNDSCNFTNSVYTTNTCNYTCYEQIGDGDEGVVAGIRNGGILTFSFYCNEDNMKVIPYLTGTINSHFVMKLDYEEDQPQYTNKYSVFENNINNIATTKVEKYTNENYDFTKNNLYYNNEDLSLNIVLKGWHTLTIQNLGDGELYFTGLEFISLNSFYASSHTIKGYTHKEWSSSPATVNYTEIDISKLYKIFKRDKEIISKASFKDIPFELTVYTEGESIVKYLFVLGANNGNVAFLSQPIKTNIKDSPNDRLCSSIAFDDTKLTINWSNNLNALSSWSIKMY